MPVLLLACLAYLSVALPGSTLGLLWPSMRLTFGAPVGALGILLVSSITASVISSVAAGRVRLPAGPLLAASVMFLTAGRGLSAGAAGVVVAAYWAMMFAGRVVLGLVAERLGQGRVLAAAVVGVPLGAALMALPIPGPGSGPLAVIGLMTLGLATAPIFPLLTLTTGQGTGSVRMVSLQVAASAAGGAALPAGLGLAIGAVSADPGSGAARARPHDGRPLRVRGRLVTPGRTRSWHLTLSP